MAVDQDDGRSQRRRRHDLCPNRSRTPNPRSRTSPRSTGKQMSVPGCAGSVIPSDDEWKWHITRIDALEQLYSAIKEATQSPCGYTPKVAEAMKKLKELE